ncbi:hypothetical protein PSTT_10517, partial [Puccinia striiformis]
VTLLARVFPHLPDNNNTLSGNRTSSRSGYHNLFSVDLRAVCNFCAAATIQTASSTPARSVGSCVLTDRRFLAKDRNQHHHRDVKSCKQESTSSLPPRANRPSLKVQGK